MKTIGIFTTDETVALRVAKTIINDYRKLGIKTIRQPRTKFDLSVEFNYENKRATNWVVRAVTKILEKDDFDILSYSENGLSITIGESMLAELTPFAGVGGNVLE